ncbi:MAG: hypothetical protein Q8R74_06595 [Methylophilus sp.]|jgi:hypothetical protein|nr:hypothetical protein [Methylophilus sp.]MDP3608720.1 hypothetical protein [Methylophilus sp.]
MSTDTPYRTHLAQPITLDDQGVYYTVNRKTGGINNVFHLVYESNEWYMYQLKNTNKEGDMGWVILADQDDYPLTSVDTETIHRLFDKPEFAEPLGAWQLMRNGRYGFGKFTPLDAQQPNRYAMVLFSGNEMLVPLLIEKAQDEVLQSLATLAK